MKKLDVLGPFKRDLKRITRRGWNRQKLDTVVLLLRQNKLLPPSARPHKLAGDWQGFWECHIGPDWLLIYNFDDIEVLLARTGTHTDLFE